MNVIQAGNIMAGGETAVGHDGTPLNERVVPEHAAKGILGSIDYNFRTDVLHGQQDSGVERQPVRWFNDSGSN